jgi:tetratricopeptide (TPR) repeat protein
MFSDLSLKGILTRYWVLPSAILISLSFLFLLPANSGLADVAPPRQPPGANLSPANEFTQVRMMEETVIIDVLPETDLSIMGQAKVWAEFHMKNLGSEAETLLVRFPISVNDGFYNYPEITDFRVYADNQNLKTEPLQMPGEHGDTIQWVHFEVVFPPGEVVVLEVEYTLQGTGEYPFVAYQYLLETGSGWKDTIGSADIIVNLPYPATHQTVFVDSSPGWGQTTPGAELEGQQVRWYFEDLEPTPANNISISMVWPSAWNKVEIERQRVASNPNDGEAWGRLGKIYKELGRLRKSFREDQGGEELFQLSMEAYENALELLPEDALWHAGLGDLLFWKYQWYFFTPTDESRAGFVRALEEFYIAYTLDPDHPFIKDYVEGRYFAEDALVYNGEEYIFLWLTQTPTLSAPEEISQATLTPTSEPEEVLPTVTESIKKNTATAVPPRQVDQKSSGKKIKLPFCGSLILFPLIALFPLMRGFIKRRY